MRGGGLKKILRGGGGGRGQLKPRKTKQILGLKRTAAQSTITGDRFVLISISASLASDSEQAADSGARSAAPASAPAPFDEEVFAFLAALGLEAPPAPLLLRLPPFPDALARIFFLGGMDVCSTYVVQMGEGEGEHQ